MKKCICISFLVFISITPVVTRDNVLMDIGNSHGFFPDNLYLSYHRDLGAGITEMEAFIRCEVGNAMSVSTLFTQKQQKVNIDAEYKSNAESSPVTKDSLTGNVIHAPDFSINLGGYFVEGTGIKITSDNNVRPGYSPSLRITASGNVNGIIKSTPFIVIPTHKNGWVNGNNLAYWNFRYYAKTSEDFRGSFRIFARVLDTQNFIHPSDPRYNQSGEPFEIPFEHTGSSDKIVNGFTFFNKSLCAIPSTHPNNRNTFGSNEVELIIYVNNAQGTIWINDLRIETTEPHIGEFTPDQWDQFETGEGIKYLGFHSPVQPEYALTHDYCSDLIIDSSIKLFRAAGFNQCRVPVYWGDHFSRTEAKIIIYNSEPDGSGDYEASLDHLEDVVANLAYYDVSSLLLLRGTPDWSHPLKHNNISDGDHGGFLNPGNPNGLGDPYPGPHTLVGHHRTYPPDNWEDWKKYVAAVVTRMKDYDVFYEIFNEINVANQANLIGGYKAVTKYLKYFSEAAFAVEPTTVVMPGAMDKMLAGCIADGIMNYANAVSYHGYSGDLSNTRGIVQSTGEMYHIWMTEHQDIHPELWNSTRMQGLWNGFSISAWAERDKYKILVLQDSGGNWVTNKMPQGLGDRVVPVQNYFAYGDMSGVLDTSDLAGNNSGRITAKIICDDHVKYGEAVEAVLKAENNTNMTFHNVKLWPVGFVENLGFDMKTIRNADVFIPEFVPGQVHEILLTIHPTTTHYKAEGVYPVCMVITNDEKKHSMVLQDIEVVSSTVR